MMRVNPIPGVQPAVYDQGMHLFDQTIKRQKQFWCPICDTWFPDDKCETAVGSPFIDKASARHAIIVFGVCTPCVEIRGRGADLGKMAQEAITERMARRAATGEPEPKDDSRRKYVMAKSGGGFRKL